MDFLTSDAFITVVSVVGSVAGLLLALRADIGRRIDRLEERAKERDQALGKRFDRLEDRTRVDHQELVAEIGQLKTAVSVIDAKLDERSSPQHLVVKEPPGDYAAGNEPEGDPEP